MSLEMTLFSDINLLVTEGIYQTSDALLQDAFRSLLRCKPELKNQLALSMYQRGKVSLARAAEIAGVDLESMKEMLQDRGIVRCIATVEETEVIDREVNQVLAIKGWQP
jgi:predicted HTH domain antitoxin